MRLLEFLNKTGEASLPTGSVEIVLGALRTTVPDPSLPIDANISDWITASDPERLIKTFVFDTPAHVAYFVSELMLYQEETHHHAKIIIDFRDVTVETYTHDINSVTRQDIVLTEFCDEIYNDISFLDYARNNVSR